MSGIQSIVIKNGVIAFKPFLAMPSTISHYSSSIETIITDKGILVSFGGSGTSVMGSLEITTTADSLCVGLITPDLNIILKTHTGSPLVVIPINKDTQFSYSPSREIKTKLYIGTKYLSSAEQVIETLAKSEAFKENIDDYVFLTIAQLKDLFKDREFTPVKIHSSGMYITVDNDGNGNSE